MIYLLLIAAICIAMIAAVAGLITAIVQAVRGRWKSAIICVAIMLFCLIGAVSGLVWGVVTGVPKVFSAAERKAKEAVAEVEADNARILKEDAARRSPPLLALTPAALRPGIDDEFWAYAGFRDWYRRPLRFPFSVMSVDSFDKGTFCVNTTAGKCSSAKEEQTLSGLTLYSFDGQMLIGVVNEDGKNSWVLYSFDGKRTDFASEAELLTAAQAAGFSGPLPMRTVKQQYDDYWK